MISVSAICHSELVSESMVDYSNDNLDHFYLK